MQSPRSIMVVSRAAGPSNLGTFIPEGLSSLCSCRGEMCKAHVLSWLLVGLHKRGACISFLYIFGSDSS